MNKRKKRGPYKSSFDKPAFLKRLKAARKDFNYYKMLGPYTGYNGIARFKHICGRVFEVRAEGMTRGARCPCLHSRILQHTPKTIRAKLVDYPGWTLHKFRDHHDCVFAHKCGTLIELTARNFFGRTSERKACPKCDGGGSPLRISEIKDRMPEGYRLIGFERHADGSRNRRNWRVKHEECGHRFTTNSNALRWYTMCPKCRTTWKEYQLGKRVVKLQGVEDMALAWMLKRRLCDPNTLCVGNEVPRFNYDEDGVTHTYFPDFYVPERNLIVEVKDPASLGTYAGKYEWFAGHWKKNKAKARAVVAAGFRFKVLVFDRGAGKRIKLPAPFLKLRRSEMLACLADH